MGDLGIELQAPVVVCDCVISWSDSLALSLHVTKIE